jgi:hypothetical protein
MVAPSVALRSVKSKVVVEFTFPPTTADPFWSEHMTIDVAAEFRRPDGITTRQ